MNKSPHMTPLPIFKIKPQGSTPPFSHNVLSSKQDGIKKGHLRAHSKGQTTNASLPSNHNSNAQPMKKTLNTHKPQPHPTNPTQRTNTAPHTAPPPPPPPPSPHTPPPAPPPQSKSDKPPPPPPPPHPPPAALNFNQSTAPSTPSNTSSAIPSSLPPPGATISPTFFPTTTPNPL